MIRENLFYASLIYFLDPLCWRVKRDGRRGSVIKVENFKVDTIFEHEVLRPTTDTFFEHRVLRPTTILGIKIDGNWEGVFRLKL